MDFQQIKTACAEQNRLLLVVRGNVYDLTDFAQDHPGGKALLEEYKGLDVTELLQDPVTHAHSLVAYDLLEDYLVAPLTEPLDGSVAVNLNGSAGPLDDCAANLNGIAANDDTVLSPLVSSADKKPPPQSKPRKLKSLFNPDKPLFYQLWTMGISRDEYIRLVHIPHYAKESFRFFENDFLEIFSRTHWWTIPLIWLPLIIASELYTYTQTSSVAYTLTAFVFGLFFWTLIEYSLHRFMFHIDKSLPDNRYAIVFHFTLHGVHHYFPMDRLRLVFPPVMGLSILFGIYCFFRVFLSHLVVVAIGGGGMTGYLIYDLTHYFLHHGVPFNQHLKFLKSYHLDHHYKDYHLGYGITTSFWDRVFGTYLDEKKVEGLAEIATPIATFV